MEYDLADIKDRFVQIGTKKEAKIIIINAAVNPNFVVLSDKISLKKSFINRNIVYNYSLRIAY